MKNLLVLALTFLIPAMGFSQNGSVYSSYKNSLVFIKSTPTETYKVVGKTGFKNSKKNVALVGADPTGIRKVVIALDDVSKKVEKGKQEAFEAVIVYSPTKMELINFDNKNSNVNRNCTVPTKGYLKRKCGSKDIFLLTTPKSAFTIVKEVEVSNFTNLGQLKMGKDDIDNFMNKLYEKSCKLAKEGLSFDAIWLDDSEMMVKGGFISTKIIKLIKYN